ncbi:glycoside hydrolase family 3 N-terminal domain-containing protein [Microbacterium sp. B2969]|uniref:Glycoside hydrolase family 3 N-terminal domain-containing protein n=1 Tax=Microbacterium alkaliflavum TaxID=3248839 RepID=A0ABW7Q5G5_9MICO
MGRARRGAIAAVAGAALLVVSLGPSAAAATTADGDPVVTVVAATPADTQAQAAALVSAMDVRQKAATVVMGHIPTTDPTALKDYLQRTGIGGFILMGANIPGSEGALHDLTTAMTIDPALPPLIAVDQEGGDVSRLPWDDFPSSVTLKTQPADASAEAFAGRGALVQRAGIGVNFGVVADVTADPSMFIYRRALGTTPDDSAARVTAAVAGEGGQALTTLKHFPGHGAAGGDSHTMIPTTGLSKADWEATDARPFAAGIKAGAELLMFGHLAYTAVDAAPASLSAEWHRIARDELGFQGVAVTDDLGMLEASGDPQYRDPVANAVAALAAGNDLLLTIMFSNADTAPRIVDGIVAAVGSGAVPAARLDDAATRVTALRLKLAAEGRGLDPCGDCTPAG